MSLQLPNLYFYTPLNYMKRTSLTLDSTVVTLGGYGSTTSYTVTHNLGYIPFFEAYADVQQNGTIWARDIVTAYTGSSLTGAPDPAYPQLRCTATTTTMTISLTNTTSPVASGSVAIYWIIYKDYSYGS